MQINVKKIPRNSFYVFRQQPCHIKVNKFYKKNVNKTAQQQQQQQ